VLLAARFRGVRTVEIDGRRVTYATDAEMAAAISDFERRIPGAQEGGLRRRILTSASKGLRKLWNIAGLAEGANVGRPAFHGQNRNDVRTPTNHRRAHVAAPAPGATPQAARAGAPWAVGRLCP
jgi:hypothetical protein